MKHLFPLLFSIGLMTACTSVPETHFPRYSEFTENKVLCARPIEPDTILFRYPHRVTVRDRVAVVMDLHNTEHYLHAFTYPDWKHIVSFGKRGEAPEEMLSIADIQFDSLDSLWVLDPNKMEMARWNISPSTHSAQRVEVVKLDKKLARALDFHTMDSEFSISDYLGEHRFWEVNKRENPSNR